MSPITIGDYSVDLFKYPFSNYSEIDSSDKYDLVYFDSTEHVFPTIIGIKVNNEDGLLKSALLGALGGGTTVHKTSFIPEQDRIVICCSDTIFCLSIPDLSLIWKTKADEATCFEIFEYQEDYIVHGELEISRLGHTGNILWQQGGADIFVSLNGANDDFAVTKEYILATDWDGNKYKFDFDGNIIV